MMGEAHTAALIVSLCTLLIIITLLIGLFSRIKKLEQRHKIDNSLLIDVRMELIKKEKEIKILRNQNELLMEESITLMNKTIQMANLLK